jgi:hypothetical protein
VDVGLGILRLSKEGLVGGARLALVASKYVGTPKLQMRQSAYGFADHDPGCYGRGFGMI